VRRVQAAAQAAIAARGRFHLALTGGSAAELYRPLSQARIDWRAVEVWWGDERAVPPDHADSNFRRAKELLLDLVPIPPANQHRMRGEAADLDAAAAEYAQALPTLDLVHLGMGPDGHVCSLFPDHPLLLETKRTVAVVSDSPKPPARRITLTLPGLRFARKLLVTVMGAEKASAVRECIERPRSRLPAARAVAGVAESAWLLDSEAALGHALPSRPSRAETPAHSPEILRSYYLRKLS